MVPICFPFVPGILAGYVYMCGGVGVHITGTPFYSFLLLWLEERFTLIIQVLFSALIFSWRNFCVVVGHIACPTQGLVSLVSSYFPF